MADHRLQIILAAKDITGTAFKRFQGRIAAITKSVFSFKGVLGALAGAGGFGLLITKSLDAADAIGKAAGVMGIHTDILQEYQHAAELSGVGTEQLNSSLQAFAKRLGEARNGTGALVTFLNKFDKELLSNLQSAKGTAPALDLVFQRMASLADASDRAALASAAFSRAGIKMVNVVKDGVAGLAKMRQEAHDMGLIIKDSFIKDAEKANDKLHTLSKVIEATFTKAIVANADALARAVEKITNITISFAKVFAGQSELEQARQRIQEIRQSIEEIQQSQAPGKNRMLESLNFALKRAEIRVYSLAQTWDESTRNIGKGLPAAARFAPPGGGSPPPAAPGFSGMDYGLAIGRGLEYAEDKERELTEAIERRMDAMNEASRQAVASGMDYSEAYTKANKEIVETSTAAAEAVAGVFENASYRMSDALVGFVGEGKISFKGLADSIIADMVRIQSQAAISGLLEHLPKIFSFGDAGGPVPAGSGGRSKFHQGGVVGSIPRLHSGLAADEYPAILQRGETVIPRGKSVGGNVQVIVNNQSGQPSKVTERRGPDNTRQIFVIVGNDIRNNGPIAQAFEGTYGLRRTGRMV